MSETSGAIHKYFRAGRLKFQNDERGVAAVEFALILPLMLMIYLGLVEMSRGLRAAQKTDLVAHVVADLTAQQLIGGANSGQAGLANADFQTIFSAAATLMNGLPTTPLKITVSQIVITGTPTTTPTSWQAKTDWTVIYNGGAARPCGVVLAPSNAAPISSSTVPTNYVTVVNGVNPVTGPIIVADVKYVYTSGINFTGSLPWFSWSSFGTFTFQRTAYAAVRNTYAPANIQYVGSITGGTDCP